MLPEFQQHLTHAPSHFSDSFEEWALEFYKAKQAERISKNTLRIYRQYLRRFLQFCNAQVISSIASLTPNIIRNYLLWLEQEGHNPGGVHAAYRVLKTFLRWYESETEPAGWRNPIAKVKAPHLAEEPIRPVPLPDVDRMVRTCDLTTFLGIRDRALLWFLLDTGARAGEVCAVDLADIDQITGAVVIRHGKGGKPRSVFLGKKARQALRAYRKQRKDKNLAAWVTDDGNRLHYGGLRAMLVRRAKLADVPTPTPHDFRRAFAINMLRNGVDLITLARLMGHTSLKVLQRYLHQLPDDLRTAHLRGSPVDHMDKERG